GAVDELPDSAEALITARIDRLAPSERTLLRQASVLGAEFPAALLPKSLDGSSPPVDEDLVDRLDGFLWRRAGMAGFHQTLVRDVAYHGLPYRRRHAWPARWGEALYRLSLPAPAEQAELLALPFFEGQRFEHAWR